MLDGEELYKSKSGGYEKGMGKQAEFIQKYFGATEEEIKKAGLTFDPKKGTMLLCLNSRGCPVSSLTFSKLSFEKEVGPED